MTPQQAPERITRRYRQLQAYIGWTEDDARRVRDAAAVVEPAFTGLVNDFYEAIEREPQTAEVITGGQPQIDRLKHTLHFWLKDLFRGVYDEAFIVRRWKVGWRHVEIGLDQVFVHAALSRLRKGMLAALETNWAGDAGGLKDAVCSLNLLLDLDLAIIQDAYQGEYVERKELAERERSEAVFRNLVEAAGCMIVILRADQTIAYINSYAEQLTGYASDAAIGKEYGKLFSPQSEQARVGEVIRHVLGGGASSWGYESRIVCRDGSERCLVWNWQRLENFRGEPALLAVGHDITARRGAEERALQAERLAAIGQTVAGLAHESRNAFQRCQACLEMLAVELEGRPQELELVQRIQRALDHLHHLYEEVRTYAAPIRLDRQMCDLSHVWRDSWSHLEIARHDKSIVLDEQTAGANLRCNVDWFQMGQVFRNILENAIAACPAEGRVEVRCASASVEGEPALRVAIRDNGPGFEPEAKGRIFDPFFTTKTKGTGLGMAIARRIVEAHGGRIEAGEFPAGAEIVVVLPRGGEAK